VAAVSVSRGPVPVAARKRPGTARAAERHIVMWPGTTFVLRKVLRHVNHHGLPQRSETRRQVLNATRKHLAWVKGAGWDGPIGRVAPWGNRCRP